MTKHGNIPGIMKERVREQLMDESDPKAIKRLTAAREYPLEDRLKRVIHTEQTQNRFCFPER